MKQANHLIKQVITNIYKHGV